MKKKSGIQSQQKKAVKNNSPKNIQLDTTGVTSKVKARAGSSLNNEGTNISYEEER
jgi:hypothetical protein